MGNNTDAQRKNRDILIFELYPVANISAENVVNDLSVPFPASDQWKARERLRWACAPD